MSLDAQFDVVHRKMLQDPKSVLAAAKKGVDAEIMVLANAWNQPPSTISYIDALDVFLEHLQEHLVPSNMNAKFSQSAYLAFSSMLGISKMGEVLPEEGLAVDLIVKAWPGIYKWSVYIFSSRIEKLDREDRRRRVAIDVLSTFWYCLCYRDIIRAQMVRTPATVEIATRLWLEEDDGPPEKRHNIPVGSCLLSCLLREARTEQLDRVLKMAKGQATEVAKLAIARLQRSLKGPNYHPRQISIMVDLINAFSRERDHPLRHALLSANVIWVMTGALVKLSVLVNTSPDPAFLDPTVSGFGYLRNCLESTDGFTWVNQTVGAGFLQAFCDCSPRFAELELEDYKMIESLIREILPRYLIYRSVIEGVAAALLKIERGAQRQRVESSKIRAHWIKFAQLAQERIKVVEEALESKGKQITCDNVKCQKIGPKESVRRCSGCLSTYYCSKECQEIAWKQGDHRTMCKLKQRSRLEGRSDNVSKRDYEFLHYFAMFDARMHVAEFRKLAQRDFPDVPLSQIVVHIDQSVLPPTYAVSDLRSYKLRDDIIISTNEGARNEALIEKVQNNPERYTIVDMNISSGSTIAKIMTLATGGFWVIDQRVAEKAAKSEALRRQESFEKALRWVFQAAEEFERSEMGKKGRRK